MEEREEHDSETLARIRIRQRPKPPPAPRISFILPPSSREWYQHLSKRSPGSGHLEAGQKSLVLNRARLFLSVSHVRVGCFGVPGWICPCLCFPLGSICPLSPQGLVWLCPSPWVFGYVCPQLLKDLFPRVRLQDFWVSVLGRVSLSPGV